MNPRLAPGEERARPRFWPEAGSASTRAPASCAATVGHSLDLARKAVTAGTSGVTRDTRERDEILRQATRDANRLCQAADTDERLPAEAAAWLRDALLGGVEAAPGHFEDDKRMKQLDADMQALFMRAGVPRE